LVPSDDDLELEEPELLGFTEATSNCGREDWACPISTMNNPMTTAAALLIACISVLRWALHAVDYQYLDWTFLTFQFQPKLLFDSGKDRRCRWLTNGLDCCGSRKILGIPRKFEIKRSIDLGRVRHGYVQGVRELLRQVGHGRCLRVNAAR